MACPDTHQQAEQVQRSLLNACLRAQNQEGPLKEGQLNVAIIGAGATGVELAAELHRAMRELVWLTVSTVSTRSATSKSA